MNDEERLEGIEKVFDDLQEMIPDHIILIEGKKDRRALDELGFTDAVDIQVQKEGGPLVSAERVRESGKKAVILTDWDDRGNRIADDLSEQLSALCVEYDVSIRERLEYYCKKDIKDVESLHTLYARLKGGRGKTY